MKHYFLLLLLLSPLLLADDQAKQVQRLEKVIWNPVTHVLSWEVTEGHIDVHGQYEPERLVGSFFIEPQAAMMSFAGKKQEFMHQEGDHVHEILDSLSHYLMSSTLWWQEGKSKPREAQKVDTALGEVDNALKNSTRSLDRQEQQSSASRHSQSSNRPIRSEAQ